MQRKLASLFLFTFPFAIASCTSSPKASQVKVTENQAKNWFEQYCSKGLRNENGDMVVHSNTKEFKGQYPANLRFDASGGFTLEVTNI